MPTIEKTTFGSITVDGKTYSHDIVIRPNGEVAKRKKKLSKRIYGTSHTLSEEEARFLCAQGCELIIIGTGQYGALHLSPEARDYFAAQGCEVILRETPEAIRLYNEAQGAIVGLFHVTC